MSEPGHDLFAAQRELRGYSIFAEVEFFSPTLQGVRPGEMEAPRIESEFLPILTSHRLVVFGGHRFPEKVAFARHLAWHLSERLPDCNVLQWYSHSSLVHLSDAFDRQPANTLFIFPSLQPHQLGGYDLRRLLEDLGNHGQYAVLTTDSNLGQWSPTPGLIEREVWCDASEGFFSPDFLAGTLLQRLEEMRDRLPAELGPHIEDLHPGAELVAGLKIRDIAGKLRTPGQIRSFVVALTSQSEISPASVEKALGHLLDERHAVHQWFRQVPSRDQLMALGLALLDGLLDDQVFAALELIVQNVWRDWESTLPHFDYHELGKVAEYFPGPGEIGRTVRIECWSPQCRRALFEISWLLHRRRILATLPALVDIARDSPGGGVDPLPASRDGLERGREGRPPEREDEEGPRTSSDSREAPVSEDDVRASRWYRHGRGRDLFGSSLRSRLLRQGMASTLSEIGLISLDAVEPLLLELAQEERQGLQAIAALALARWREIEPRDEGDRKLFRTLSAWQSEAFQKEYSHLRQRRRMAAKPYAYVRATIALTLSRAALYDPPNRLRDPLVRLFEKLIEDRSPIVRSRFRNDTLPTLVAGHLSQLEEILWTRVLSQEDLLTGTALGLARAHLLRPQEGGPVLEAWSRRALDLSATDRDEDQRRLRAHALAVVALAYGQLIPGSRPGSLSAEQIFDFLGQLLATEEHPLVRAAVLSAMILQAKADPDRAAPLVQELVEELALEERGIVVGLMTELYLEQRRQLEGSAGCGGGPGPDTHELVGPARYPLWTETGRPSTSIERILYDWLQEPERPVALQIALECLESFAATALEERERQLRKEREEIAEAATGEIPAEFPFSRERTRLRRLSVAGWLAVLAAAPLSSHRRAVLRIALPEHLRQVSTSEHPARPGTLAALLAIPETRDTPLLARLRESADSFGEDLARQLALAGQIHAWRWPLGLLLTLVFVATLGTLVLLLS
jgi:hypothetical protein